MTTNNILVYFLDFFSYIKMVANVFLRLKTVYNYLFSLVIHFIWFANIFGLFNGLFIFTFIWKAHTHIES